MRVIDTNLPPEELEAEIEKRQSEVERLQWEVCRFREAKTAAAVRQAYGLLDNVKLVPLKGQHLYLSAEDYDLVEELRQLCGYILDNYRRKIECEE